jgi:hypothetical protein
MAQKIERPVSVFHRRNDDKDQINIRMSTNMIEALKKVAASDQWDETLQQTVILIVDKFLQENEENFSFKRPKER